MHHGLLAGRRSRVLSFVQRDLLLPVAKLWMYWMAALGLVFWDPSGCPLEPASFMLHSLHSQQMSIISLILFCPIFTHKDFQYSPKALKSTNMILDLPEMGFYFTRIWVKGNLLSCFFPLDSSFPKLTPPILDLGVTTVPIVPVSTSIHLIEGLSSPSVCLSVCRAGCAWSVQWGLMSETVWIP